MKKNSAKFAIAVDKIVEKDSRYPADSYSFVMDAVVYTMRKRKDDDKLPTQGGGSSHVSGQELLEGIKEFAIVQFGPMASEVFRHWGITNSVSVGNIVFNMVENNLLGKSDADRPEDFNKGFDVDSDLSEPFMPQNTENPRLPVIE
ncbi:MAG: hypothetical protein JW808_08770 [Victivallales bacterium]|nr:hypothetical protein [Victivallales bacterium]